MNVTRPSEGDAYRWIEPTTTDDAEERATNLLNDIEKINIQLGDRDRRSPETGERLHDREYWLWRSKALRVRTNKLKEYRQLKRWLKKRHTK